MLGSVTDSTTAVIDFESKGEFEFSRTEDWLEGWFMDGSRMNTGAGAGIHRQGNRAFVSVSLGRWALVCQAEVFAIAVCIRSPMEMDWASSN